MGSCILNPLRSVVGLAALGLAACGGSAPRLSSSQEPGTLLAHPDSSPTRSQRFFVDPNSGGQASALHLTGASWGRLVDVYDLDPAGERRLQQERYPIGAEVTSDGHALVLDTNPVTGRQSLVVLTTHTAEGDEFDRILADLDRHLIPVQDKALSEVGLYTMVPRNAVLVLQFDDLLDPELVSPESVRTYVANPPSVPFPLRILLDYNHGDVVGEGSQRHFCSTRVLIDPTTTVFESLESDPPADVNGSGFPAAVNPNQANLAVRLPTQEKPSIGIDEILRNLRGNALARTQNGTIDFASPTVDVVRYMRSGGNPEITGDPSNGFLRDEETPRVTGDQTVVLLESPVDDPDSDSPFDLILPRIEFLSPACVLAPVAGDVIVQGAHYAEVRRTAASASTTAFRDVAVRLLLGDAEEWAHSAIGTAHFLAPYDPSEDATKEFCFVQVLPLPDGYPAEPSEGISVDSLFRVRFSEPMDPASLTAFDSLTLTRAPVPDGSQDYVVGTVHQSQDLASYLFAPDLPLAHQQGLAEPYHLTLATGQFSPTDLAGNPLQYGLPSVAFLTLPSQPSEHNGGRVSRFSSPDEDEPIGGDTSSYPEWTGQHLYDLARQLIRPRPVVHSLAVADRSQPILSLLATFGPGVQTPLARLGSKLQLVWRYADVGFSLTDATSFNMDVEGLAWTPNNGVVLADHYSEFEMRLSHSRKQPDEFVAQSTNLPAYPSSGLRTDFFENLLNSATDPQKIVHPKQRGYTLNPSDAFATPTGTLMVPWPLNRGLPAAEQRFYTWRDTTLYDRAAPQGGGVDLHQLWEVLGIGVPNLMPTDYVTTIGLPLLIEIRCYPDDQAAGLNPHQILLGSLSTAQPNFRAFSTGGVDQTGNVVRIDPDTETRANGGFNPNSNPPGAPTPGVDNSVYLGAMSLVTRVSRSVSIWFDVGGIADVHFRPAVIEPRLEDQPAGTSIELAFRGAFVVEPPDARQSAATLDLYGEYYDSPATDRWHPNPAIVLQNDGRWSSDISEVDGASYYQVRVTFLSDPESGVTPELSALAVAWSGQ